MSNTVVLTALAVLFSIGMTAPAYAYLDPGTGSILLQGLVAAVAGGIVAAKLYWGKLKEFLSFAKKHDESPR